MEAITAANSTTVISPDPIPTGADVVSNDFIAGLTQSLILVFLAEIGDKTFIMVMLLSNKMNKFVLWLLATIAMNIMNAVSVTIGTIFPLFLPRYLISIVVIVLFFTFGLKMLYTALCHSNEGEGDEELEEAKETLERLEALKEKKEPLLGEHASTPKASSWKFWERSQYSLFMFLLMCTEWGDVSQMVAIGLAAKYGMLSIIIGGGLGFALCITLAILVGSVVSKVCSERWLGLFSGILFTAFGVRELLHLLSSA